MRSSSEALRAQHLAPVLPPARRTTRDELGRVHRQHEPLRALVDVDDVGDGRAERRPDRRDVGERDDEALHSDLARDRGRVDRAHPAVGEAGELPRVQAAQDAHAPQEVGHLAVDDAVDARRGLVDRRGRAARRARRSAASAAPRSSGAAPCRKFVGVDDAEHDVGVGHGRLGAAAAVARRARVRRPRDCGPTCSPPELVEPRDAAAAGADRVDVRPSAARSRSARARTSRAGPARRRG